MLNLFFLLLIEVIEDKMGFPCENKNLDLSKIYDLRTTIVRPSLFS